MQTAAYLPLLKGKRVAVVSNQTSRIAGAHLVDSLLQLKISIVKVMAPEHGFRGQASAGETVLDGKDRKTGLPVLSLYGDRKKPDAGSLNDVDIILFDIQDVGARFYTYISTLELVMQACAEYGIPLVILDRPNPNGHIVDGPVLDTAYRSFVGMQPIPVLHGMTVGEYARMLIGEKWVSNSMPLELTVIPLMNWKHSDPYDLPIPPSPNLPNAVSVNLYASLCFFEGTSFSLGRGTPFPFQIYGSPEYPMSGFSFTPVDIPGVALNPPHRSVVCNGVDLRKEPRLHQLEIKWLLDAYSKSVDRSSFFNSFFNKLAGNKLLQEQIKSGWSEDQIRKSWEEELTRFKRIRNRYLLYPEK